MDIQLLLQLIRLNWRFHSYSTQPDATKVEEREPTRSHVLRMTEEEQVDLFNEVVEPTPKEKVL
jgi:hypothetical protein